MPIWIIPLPIGTMRRKPRIIPMMLPCHPADGGAADDAGRYIAHLHPLEGDRRSRIGLGSQDDPGYRGDETRDDEQIQVICLFLINSFTDVITGLNTL